MILSRVSIQRPVLATMMNLVLVLFGMIGLSRLPVRELPDIDPPIVSVSTVYPGANAQVVETEVTERLEEQINNIEGIKTLTSESREGVSNITIEFDLSRNIDVAAQDVRDRVSRVRGQLPTDIREPIIAKQDSDAQPIIWNALNSGRVENLDREMTIQTRGELKTADEYNDLVLRTEGATSVRMRDIGRAEEGVEDYRTIARAAGKPCVFLGVVKQAKANTVSVAQGIKAEIKAIKPTLPEGCDLWPAYDASTYV